MKTVTRVSVGLVLGAVAALGQNVISARSGIVHYVEGTVFLGDQQVERKFGNFPEINENAVLRTTDQGRAEVLLTPGVFLRLGEASSFRMIAKSLEDTRLEVLGGSAIIEATDLPKDNSVSVLCKGFTVHLDKMGLYRLDYQPAALHVFDGRATVTSGEESVEVKEGRMVAFETPLTLAKFDKEGFDSLDRWSRNRDAVVATANVASAQSAYRSGQYFTTSRWAFNPWFGMYTFLPWDGSFMSPYGYSFWSPRLINDAYWGAYPRYNPGWNHGGSASGGGSIVRPGTGTAPASRVAMRPARSSGDFGARDSVRPGASGGGGYSGSMPSMPSMPSPSSGGGGAPSGARSGGGGPSRR